MKRFLIFITVLSMLLSSVVVAFAADDEIVITKDKSRATEEYLWDTLNKYLDNEKIIAGILAYYKRESSYKSNAVAGLYFYGDEYEQKETNRFVKEIDKGLEDGSSKEEFIHYVHYVHGGFGLGQWCSIESLEDFYAYAQEWGTSIADAEMQCAFTVQHMKTHGSHVWKWIKNEKDVAQIAQYIGTFYDGTVRGGGIMAGYAPKIYKRYASEFEGK